MTPRSRILWGGAAALLALGAMALTLVLTARPEVVPFRGAHQAGIATPAPRFAFVVAFDVTAPSADELRDLFKRWTVLSEALTANRPVGVDGPRSAPPADTGEVLGYRPSRLTLTFGVGPSLFDGRFGLADRRPAALAPLPAFHGDQLRPEWSDGDLVVQAAADDYQSVYHAVHTLARAAKGLATLRWVQAGFQAGDETKPAGPGRNLQGFIDGTVNPDASKDEDLEKVVWADRGAGWMEGGSYLVVRRIRMFVEVWDRSALGDQERTIGRDRAHGEMLAQADPASHVLTARGAGVEKILRRPFHYVNGLDPRTGQWDSGLLFLAWMKDPQRQFVPMQTRISDYDKLNEYIQVQGSAVFAAFPGVAPGSYLGAGLLPEAPLTQRIEALEAGVGALYPALAAGDWPALRTGAAEWNQLWTRSAGAAGDRHRALEALKDAWALSLAPDAPDAPTVRSAMGALGRALGAWAAAEAPAAGRSASALGPLKARLAEVDRALGAGQAAQARTAFGAFQKEWTTQEALVRSLDGTVYGAVELAIGTLRAGLAAEVPGPGVRAGVQDLAGRLAGLRAPTAFGAWDAGFLLIREGLEALLVLGALLAFLNKTDQRRRTPWVWAGAGSGLAASAGVAFVVSVLLAGWGAATAPQLVEGLVGLAAVVLMLTVGAWLHGKATVKNWNLWLKDQMGRAGNSPWALATLAFLAVLREGAETVVFFWGLAGSLSPGDLALGLAGGTLVLGVLGVLMLGFAKRLPLQWFFPIATALIYFLAVKILGQSLASLQSAGWLPASPLGFAGSVDLVGFVPTWETALPQLVLALVLGVLIVRPLLKRPASGPGKA